MKNRTRILLIMLAMIITLGAFLIHAGAGNVVGFELNEQHEKDVSEKLKEEAEQKAEEEAQTAVKTYDEDLAYLEGLKYGGWRALIFKIKVFAAGENPRFNLSDLSSALLRLSDDPENEGDERGIIPAIVTYGRNTFKALEMIGIMLMTMYFIIYSLDMVQSDNFTPEQFYKRLIIFAIALFLMMNGTRLFEGIIRVFDTLLIESNFSNTAASSGNTVTGQMFEILSDKSKGIMFLIGELAAAVLVSIIPLAVQLAAVIIVFFIAISRLIEIIVRYAFAPIALAPIAGEGLRSSSIRYIKKFAACCLHGVVIIFVLSMTGNLHDLLGSIMSNRWFSGLLGEIIIPILVVAGVFKAGKLADDIMGV